MLTGIQLTTHQYKIGNSPLSRPQATRAAMIPISKNESWWVYTVVVRGNDDNPSYAAG